MLSRSGPRITNELLPDGKTIFTSFGDATPARWISMPGGSHEDPRAGTAVSPQSVSPHEKPLEEFLKGDLKPIKCRWLGKDKHWCTEMSIKEDASKGWPGAPGVAYSQTHYLSTEGARGKEASLDELTQKLSFVPHNKLTIDKFPTQTSAGL